MQLPNIHSNFVPDPGYMIFDVDLEGADAQVVAWDSGCERMKWAFREGMDHHLVNARALFDLPISDDALRDPEHVEQTLKKKYKHERYQSKRGGHGTNYLASAKTVAAALRISEKQAEKFQRLYFELNPEILDWHDRIEQDIQTKKYIQNVFGYHVHFFDRPESIMSNAVAWIPQSTVAIITNHIWDNFVTNLTDWDVQVFFQVHDSLVGQFPKKYYPEILPHLQRETLVEMPYEDPHAIPTGLEVSERSWGHVQPVSWEAA